LKYKRIRDLREDSDKLQKDIANVLGISQQYYSEYENGNRPIPVQHLITLAKYYNTTIDYIVGLTNERNKKSSWNEQSGDTSQNVQKLYILGSVPRLLRFKFPFGYLRKSQQTVPPFSQYLSF